MKSLPPPPGSAKAAFQRSRALLRPILDSVTGASEPDVEIDRALRRIGVSAANLSSLAPAKRADALRGLRSDIDIVLTAIAARRTGI